MHPSRGDVWYADLSPVRGHEQDGVRPVLVVSADEMNASAVRMVIVLPLTRNSYRHPTRIEVIPPEGGIREPSYALCMQIRAISTNRLDRRLGRVSEQTLERVSRPLRALLEL